MRDCKEFAESIPDYIDDQADSELLQKIHHHMAGCSSCRRISEDLRYIRSCLCQAEPVTTASGFNQQVMQRIRHQSDSMRTGLYSRYHTMFNIAATFLLVFGAFWSYRLWNVQNAPRLESLTQNQVSVIRDYSNKMVAFSNSPGLLDGQASAHAIGWIGIGVTLQHGNQVIISEVVSGTPAEKTGIRPGDILVSINGVTITHPQQLEQFIRNIRDNSELLDIILQRQQTTVETQLVMESRLIQDQK
ncbi:MAG: PDZ domain-containing protein [Candidatus Delongbacteria bacterium]|nr:PDZ domain-containing protein [Candidatus Delongbacteria bacterium]